MKRRVLFIAMVFVGVWLASVPLAQESIQIGGPIFQGLDNNGDPCDGCKLYVFTSGTTTAVSTYTSRARSTSHTSPVVLDAAGRAVVFVDAAGIYDVRLDSPADVTIWTMLGVGEPVQDASGLTSTAGIDVELDTDNNTSNAAFRVLNGLDAAVFSVTENDSITGSQIVTCTGTSSDTDVCRGDGTWGVAPICTGTSSDTDVCRGDGTWGVAPICTGTPSDTDVCRGDGTWGVVPIGFDTADWSGLTTTQFQTTTCPNTAGSLTPGNGIGRQTGSHQSQYTFSNTNPFTGVFVTTAKPVLNYDVTFLSSFQSPSTAGTLQIWAGPNSGNRMTMVASMATSSSFRRITGSTNVSDGFITIGPTTILIHTRTDAGASRYCINISSVWLTA